MKTKKTPVKQTTLDIHTPLIEFQKAIESASRNDLENISVQIFGKLKAQAKTIDEQRQAIVYLVGKLKKYENRD